MISDSDRESLCTLVDELRRRGVQVAHIENGPLKIELHMTPPEPAHVPPTESVQDKMLNDPNVPEATKEAIRRAQTEQDLYDAV